MSKFHKMTSVAAVILACASLVPLTTAAAPEAATTMSKIAVHEGRTGAELRFALSTALPEVPKVFSMSNPSRIVFDIPGVINGTGLRKHVVNQGGILDVQVIQAQGVSRVVVQVKEILTHSLKLDGRELVLSVGEVAVAPVVKTFATGANGSHALAGVDFRRGPGGEGRVVIDLSDDNAGIDIRQQGSSIVVDFKGADVAERLLRRMNVTDFGTPVKNVTLSRQGGGVRMLIEPQGLWEYNAYQTDSRFVLEVRPVKYDPNKLAQGESIGYKGERMSLNFQNVDVRNLLSVIADFTKLNIVSSDSVSGNMTIRLQDVPWDQALDVILQSRGLDMRKSGNVIWVGPAEEIAKREKDKIDLVAQSAGSEPLRTESFQLNYTRAEDVAPLLSNDKQKILSVRGSVVIDARTNQIFVQDNNSKLEDVAKMIKKIDIPVRQVMIEARIVEAGDKFSRALGARLGFTQPSSASLFGGPTKINFGNGNPSNNLSNLPAPALDTGAAAANFAVSLLNGAGTSFLSLELSALEADGRGKIVSSPSIVTSDKETALIEQGTELPYAEASSSGAATIAFKKANLRLEVTPQITPDGNVIMSVDINKDAPGAPTISGLSIDTKHIKTKVLVENGGTIVIGGIFVQEERNDVNKVPFLGDLPGVGNLFKNTVKKDSKTELMIFLTPRILDARLGVAQVK